MEFKIILVVVLLLLLYTAVVVKEEKKAFLENIRLLKLQDIRLAVPSWWQVKEKKSHSFLFHRTDTFYEWESLFEYRDQSESEERKSLEEVSRSYLEDNKIVMDTGAIISHEMTCIENKNSFSSCYRIEGTATQDLENRLYIDLILLKMAHKNQVLLCLNKSSVLNGMIEGPYFEEVVKKITVRPSFLS